MSAYRSDATESRPRHGTRALRIAAACAAGAIALTGCGFKGAYSLPLPGGAAHGKTYHVTAIFNDVQDLTVQAAVRVNDVAVGDVTSIEIGTNPNRAGYLKANVGMSINSTTKLPVNSIATLEQTTLLGEKFIAIAPPVNQTPATALLANDAVISNREENRTGDLPSVEEVFGLLSQVLNGGDLADLQTINVEVSKALAGREQAVRGALTQLTTFVTGLNQQKQEIVRALDELNRFSGALAKQNGTIATALTDLGPGLRVLADERAQFTSLLTDLSRFGAVASHVIRASKTQTIQGLADLQPILGHLAAAGKSLPRSLEILITFPFPRDSSEASPGDYTNFAANLNISPILCAAVAGFTKAEVDVLRLADPLLTTLGIQKCPTSDSVKSPVDTPLPGGTGTGTGATGATGTTGTTGTTGDGDSTPPPADGSDTGLAQLLNGLIGGGKQ